jgi:hypothetical protein
MFWVEVQPERRDVAFLSIDFDVDFDPISLELMDDTVLDIAIV